MIIRKVTYKDIDECVELSNIQELFSTGDIPPDQDFFIESLDKHFYVAIVNDDIIGLILGFELTKSIVYLDLFTIKNEYRNKGYGNQLMNYFEDELKNVRVRKIFLIAPSFNKKTLDFYRANDFEEGKEYILFEKNLRTTKRWL